jgi:hypothetical protein
MSYKVKHKFPRGYKTYCVLKEMIDRDGMTYTEIIMFAYEMNHGKGSFDKLDNRGYWSGAFVSGVGGYPWQTSRTPGTIYTNANKCKDGKWRVNDNGRRFIAKYDPQFQGVNRGNAQEMKIENDVKNERIELLKLRYSKQLENFEKGNQEKYCDQLYEKYCDQLDMVSEVTMRGLKLDDEVIYYRKKTGESGEGYVSSMTTYSKRVVNQNCFSLAVENGFIKGIGYVENEDMFLESTGDEIQIIKKKL